MSAEELKRWLALATEPVGCCLVAATTSRSRRGSRVRKIVAGWAVNYRGWAAAAALPLLSILLVGVRNTYRVPAHCVVQPMIRRYIAAPFAGELDACLAKPGDMVVPGQLLGRMKKENVMSELAAVAAEAERAAKERDVNLAAGKVAAAQMAALDFEPSNAAARRSPNALLSSKSNAPSPVW